MKKNITDSSADGFSAESRHGNRIGAVQKKSVSTCLEDNKNTLKTVFDSNKNFDLVFRDFSINASGKEYPAFLIFFDK